MEEKRPNTPRNSTVAVSPEIGKKLERFCDSCGIGKFTHHCPPPFTLK